ncbi:hypothetical protein ACQCX5_09810 [Propionibacteriaceae bacterium G57]|uniref:hypothetical protein n=1 Tax=Aestuariimicrobium sp. G57 TaxID=3418485 RepID=UPI003DA78113
MSGTTYGEIDRYLATVGTRPADNEQAFDELLTSLAEVPEVTPFDRGDNKQSTYWGYHSHGVELLWSDKRLVSVTIFVTPDADQGYAAHPRPLFDNLPAHPTRAQVEGEFGGPDQQGEWEGVWIRYDNLPGDDGRHQLRFEFADDGELITVGVTAADF